jgi:hypothetical protein
MDDIIEPTIDYDFSKLYLGPPATLAGGAYFTRLMYNTNKQLFIQTPKSLTKQGFIKTGKKVYTDLMFDNNDTVFINWIENLETKCQELIFNKGQNWFETKLEKDDIETAFTSPFKIFKSGKYYLLRVNVKPNIKIYDEKDQIINAEDLSSDKNIISILEIQGIKFTSRNFQIEFELKQSMIVSPDPFLDTCFIKKPSKPQTIKDDVNEKQFSENLDDFINKSANDLAQTMKTNNDLETFEQKKNKPIDLNITFDESDNFDNVRDDTVIDDNVIDDDITNDNVTNDNVTNNDLFELEEAEIVLDVEELKPEIIEDPNVLKEVDFASTLENNLETITLKKPNQVYHEIYQKAREKAKEAKKTAILAYLEMKNIKKTYMLDDIDDSDSEFEDFASVSETSDTESLEDNFE